MAKGIGGSVLATFVVNVDGRPDLDTYMALEASDSLFAQAVREALPRMKFRPAKINDKPVRQLVEQRFLFKVVQPTGAGQTVVEAMPSTARSSAPWPWAMSVSMRAAIAGRVASG